MSEQNKNFLENLADLENKKENIEEQKIQSQQENTKNLNLNHEEDEGVKKDSNQNVDDYNDPLKYDEAREKEREEQEFLNRLNSSNHLKNHLEKFIYPSYFKRFIAFLVDLFLANRLFNIILFFIPSIPKFVYIISMDDLVFLLYSFVSVFLTNGHTIGKILVNLKVHRLDEEKLDLSTIFIREIVGKFILMTLPILFVLMFFTKKRQHLGDIFADTVVIDERSYKAIDEVAEYVRYI